MSEHIKKLDARINELQEERQARDIELIARIKHILDLPETVALKKHECPILRLKQILEHWEEIRNTEHNAYNLAMNDLIMALKKEHYGF